MFETSGWASKLVEFVITSSFLAITRCSSSAVSIFSPFGRMMLLQSLLGTSGDLFLRSSSGQVSVNLGWDFGELNVSPFLQPVGLGASFWEPARSSCMR